jgi:hypothetical protein
MCEYADVQMKTINEYADAGMCGCANEEKNNVQMRECADVQIKMT